MSQTISLLRALCLGAVVPFVMGCGNGEERRVGRDDAAVADAIMADGARRDAATTDAATTDAAATDASTTDASTTDVTVPPDVEPQDQFPLRPLESHDLACPGGTMTYWDADFFCRVPIDDTSIDLYVQATPTECVSAGMSDIPVFGDVLGWYQNDGAGPVWPTDAAYEWGGNHHNDEIKFVFEGTVYDIWHSSFGFGWRACAPPDCLLTCDVGATFETCDYLAEPLIVVDGCERTKPPHHDSP